MDKSTDNSLSQGEQIRTIRPNLIVNSSVAVPDLFFVNGAANLALILLSDTYATSYLPILSVQAGLTFMGTYLMSASVDMFRGGTCPIDFQKHFGVEPREAPVMPKEVRVNEARTLIEKLNDEFVEQRYSTKELGEMVDEVVTAYIAGLTGQRIETSNRLRDKGVATALLPFVEGLTEPYGGEIWLPNKRKVRRPHFAAHELCHRKGYRTELDVQILAYCALSGSDDPIFRQAAFAERLYRTLESLPEKDKVPILEQNPVREELRDDICPEYKLNPLQLAFSIPFTLFYLVKMKSSGQTGGYKDYGEGLVNFLHATGDKV
jgi:hypothetical protein